MTKAEEIKTIPEGIHEGVITNVELRKPEGYDYVYADVYVKLTSVEGEPTIKTGYPDRITIDSLGNPSSNLARLLVRFGIQLQKGEDYNAGEILKDKEVSLVTVNEKSARGTFARVADNSLKPRN